MAAREIALETVAKTKCENGFHIKKKDRKCFMKAITSVLVTCDVLQRKEENYCVYENKTDIEQMMMTAEKRIQQTSSEVKIQMDGEYKYRGQGHELSVGAKHEGINREENKRELNELFLQKHV